MDCIFCKIFNNELPSKKVFESDSVIAFYDINPQAPLHIVVIHKDHTSSVSMTPPEKSHIFSEIFSAIREIAQLLSLDELGYRLVINNGKAAGQSVYHVHVNVLGGAESLGPIICKNDYFDE